MCCSGVGTLEQRATQVSLLIWSFVVEVSFSGCSTKVEAAGIEPASESLQLQPLHMLFQGQNSHPPDLPGGTRRVLARYKFRQAPPPGVGEGRLSHIVTPYTTTVGE